MHWRVTYAILYFNKMQRVVIRLHGLNQVLDGLMELYRQLIQQQIELLFMNFYMMEHIIMVENLVIQKMDIQQHE